MLPDVATDIISRIVFHQPASFPSQLFASILNNDKGSDKQEDLTHDERERKRAPWERIEVQARRRKNPSRNNGRKMKKLKGTRKSRKTAKNEKEQKGEWRQKEKRWDDRLQEESSWGNLLSAIEPSSQEYMNDQTTQTSHTNQCKSTDCVHTENRDLKWSSFVVATVTELAWFNTCLHLFLFLSPFVQISHALPFRWRVHSHTHQQTSPRLAEVWGGSKCTYPRTVFPHLCSEFALTPSCSSSLEISVVEEQVSLVRPCNFSPRSFSCNMLTENKKV